MPEKKKRRGTSVAIRTETRGQSIILEEMRAQNRATIEAVEASRAVLEEKIDRADRESRERDALLELTVRGLRKTVEKNSDDIQQNSAEIRRLRSSVAGNGQDIRALTARVDALGTLDQRLTALERPSSE